MERKIGEVFEYEGEKLKVVNAGTACDGCYFKGKSCDNRNYDITGICGWVRKDHQPVRFIKVTEEQQEEQTQQQTEEPKERKIGEVFEYEGKKLKVVETEGSTCYNCYFEDRDCDCDTRKVLGACLSETRTDNKPVIFVEVEEEAEEQQQEEQKEGQPQAEQQPQKLDLCEILKYCPAGEPFWSPMLGDVKFYGIDYTIKRACVTAVNNVTWGINADGTITIGNITSEEVMLYPSREQRDWSKVKYEKKKKELPRTWEEFCKNYPKGETECLFDGCCKFVNARVGGDKRHKYYDMNVLPSQQAAEAHLALMQLHQLRDAWREGWMPDWRDDTRSKYVIINIEGDFIISKYYTASCFLSFQDERRAYEFLECFIDLIRIAGDLI